MGFPYAMYLLARCYVSGTYVKQDLPQAAQWFLKGAEAGNKDCCYAVGLMYANGDGVKQDAKEAKKWLRLAADKGVKDAEEALGAL